MIKRNLFFLSVLALTLLAGNVFAGITTPAVNVVEVRAYSNGDVYVRLSSNATCDTNVFKIVGSDLGSAKMHSLAITALTANKKVKVEVYNSTGCNGWGTPMQSIYLQND